MTPNKSPIPTALQDFIRTKSPPVRLYVWRCSIIGSRTTAAQTQSIPQLPHIASIPTANLAGLSMCRLFSRGRDVHEVLAELVTSSPNLESLELFRMTSKFYGSRRLPPIKHLSLSRSNWTYTTDEVSRIWDFSRLETLRITEKSLSVNFMKSVHGKTLPCLKRLTIEMIRGLPATEDQLEMVGRFLLETPQLLEIHLTIALCSAPIASIARHSSLRSLKLNDRNWKTMRGEVAGMITVSDLEVLQTSCKHLVELTLDVRDCDASIIIPVAPVC